MTAAAATRTTLSLKEKSPVPEAPPPPAKPPAPPHIKFNELCRIMASYWPAVFDPTLVRPLAVGTYGDIIADIKKRSLALDAKADIRRFLGIHCTKTLYLQAITAGAPRYTLTGEIKGEVTQGEMADAQSKLAEIDKAFQEKIAKAEASKRSKKPKKPKKAAP